MSNSTPHAFRLGDRIRYLVSGELGHVTWENIAQKPTRISITLDDGTIISTPASYVERA